MRKLLLCAAAIAASSLTAGVAEAAVTVNFTQAGSNVLVTTSGTLDITGLTNQGDNAKGDSYTIPNTALISTGLDGSLTIYGGLTGPSSFGTMGRTTADSSTGNVFELFGEVGQVRVYQGFVSGGSFASTATFNNTTIAALGLTSGQYVYNAPRDTITVNIGGAVPEPATWGMMLLGFGMVGLSMRRRARVSAAKFA